MDADALDTSSAGTLDLTRQTPPRAATARFLLASLLLGVLVFVLAALLPPAGIGSGALAALVFFAVVCAITSVSLAAGYPYRRLGWCNIVTLTRAAIATILAAPIFTPGLHAGDSETAWILFGLALLALSLDGIDGWLARRSRLVSVFGARFDMETDALLALVLSVLAWQAEKAGAWVLLLGLIRYIYVLASFAWPVLTVELPQRLRRKTVCVIQIGVLVILLAPPVTAPLSSWLAMTALVLLVWSFAVDILWQRRLAAR